MKTMNILLFLTPKSNVEYLEDNFTIRQALEKMEFHNYSAIPVLDKEGKYVETISDGDLLREIKLHKLNWEEAMKIKVLDIHLLRNIKPIKIDNTMDDLIELIVNQNFVPVIDDMEHFIGIITRKAVIEYMNNELKN
jgi:CBS-domain-containing membrane protein